MRRQMLRKWRLCCLTSWTLVLVAAGASAESIGRTEVLLASEGEERMTSPRPISAKLDYAIFAYELLAFVTKEVLPDSQDEYPESPIGSRLSESMPERGSEFGSHCLTVVTQLGSAVPYLSAGSAQFAAASASPLDDLARTAAAALAVRRMWSAVANDPGENRRGLSLNPKVGTNRVGVSLTLHW